MTQFARPDSDIQETNWSPDTGSDLFAMIDNTASGSTDKISSQSASFSNIAIVGLSSVTDPTIHTGHILRIEHDMHASEDVVVSLRQGTTVIETYTINGTGSKDVHAQNLGSTEMANISDYTDLNVRLTNLGLNQPVLIYWVELEVPNIPSDSSIAMRHYYSAASQVL